jgi:hypothetical protein
MIRPYVPNVYPLRLEGLATRSLQTRSPGKRADALNEPTEEHGIIDDGAHAATTRQNDCAAS